ncbi:MULTISPECIES: hypothetical protein [Hyphomicrobiales]|uniref:hypothetical protein n=1 Tax=Agrobacterium pusense TaxID=648995 RepID=UPI0012FD6430|nr:MULTISPECIES: hypothetical protein [Brucella/Ochrobactrum group]
MLIVQSPQAKLNQLFILKSMGPEPTYLGDQFDGLDHAVVDTSDLADLADQWQLIDREIAGWSIGPEDM